MSIKYSELPQKYQQTEFNAKYKQTGSEMGWLFDENNKLLVEAGKEAAQKQNPTHEKSKFMFNL